MRFLSVSLGGALVVLSSLGVADAAEGTSVDRYEIVRADADRIWRLDKATGEIAVCALDGERLVCTSSTEAIEPPAMTYEERQTERERQAAEAEALRQIERARDLEMLDRALAAFRELMAAAIERERATSE